MLSIHLKDLVFHAKHGVYEEEKILGNKFVVNVHVHFTPASAVVTQLHETINYESLFTLVRKRMTEPTALLETVAMEICNSIMQNFNQVDAVYAGIEKTNPPIASLEGSVVVSYQLSRE